jgi:hypothetical protein
VTTFVEALEDTNGLRRWELRQLAVGMGQRPDLVLAAAATDSDDKDRLDEIVRKATEHALASASATTGTSLHALTERLDRGGKLGVVPDPYGADLKAYETATAAIEFDRIETFRVLDGWKVAGTADRIGRYRGRLMVADIKTGSIDYPHKMAMQLALYAHSVPYDIVTDTRGPADVGLDLRRGLIIHLRAGQGRCELHLVDLEKGWEACQLAKQVWDFRSTRSLLAPASFAELARTADDIEALRQLWRDAKRCNELTQNFLDAVEKRREQLAVKHP